MIFVTGGLCSGKTEWVKTALSFNEDDIANAVLDDKPVLDNLHLLILKDISKWSTGEIEKELLLKEVIICSEIGCGIVPIEYSEREYREIVGRVGIALAKKATKVVKLVSGIAMVIKE